jgi:hypothetical protein
VTIQERTQVLSDIADGKLALRDFLQLSKNDVLSIARLGASAFEAKKFDLAVAVFTALEALEPREPIHTIHRAHSEAAAGKTAEAIASATRFFERDDNPSKEDLVRMLLLRATLYAGSDRARAETDLRSVQALAPEMMPGAPSANGGAR